MFRSIPVANKLCFDKQLKRSWQIHEKKLKTLKSSIDRNKPQEFQFLYSRPKKQVLQDLRNTEIMRENKVLLSKISEISQEGKMFANSGDLNKLLRRAKSTVPQNFKKTLNEPFRKRELVKIVQENQDMLKRIQERKSCYNIRRMARDRQSIEKNIHLISSFPYKDFKRNKTQVNLWMTNTSMNDRTNRQLSPEQSKKSHSPQKSASQPIDLSFKKTKNINGSYFLITADISKDKFFIVQLENLECFTQKYCLRLPENEARKFLKVYFNNNLQKMLDNLVIDPQDQSCYLKYEVSRVNTDTSPGGKLPKINENSQQLSRVEEKGSNQQNKAPEVKTAPHQSH